ncbi:MAG: hypothetical protein KY443_08530 [Actinobacteria bacterium]|nr:hypothetical protein [Actinomycetota bacterium]
MNEHDALIRRLQHLGTAPVDSGVAASHLAGLSTIAPAPVQPFKRGHLMVVGAMVATTFVSSTAMAGAMTGRLPGPAQDVAHTVLAKVGTDVPRSEKGQARAAAAKAANGERKAAKGGADDGAPGVARFLGDETTPCTLPDGSPFEGTHGEYVAAHPDDPDTPDVNERELAAQSPCGMPLDAVDATHDPAADKGKGKGNDGGGKPATRPAGGKPATTGKPTTTTTTTVEAESNTGTDGGDGDGETEQRTRRTGRPTTTVQP